MFVSKSKVYTNISVDEIKQDLRIYSGDTQYDAELSRLIKSAVAIAEKKISGDIVYTINQLEDYGVYGSCYRIDDINLTISAITSTNNISTTPINNIVSGYTIQKYNNYTLIKFKNSVSAEKLHIVYTSGYVAEIPNDILRAITIKVSELLDVDKSGYVSSSVKESQAFDRILSPHINLFMD